MANDFETLFETRTAGGHVGPAVLAAWPEGVVRRVAQGAEFIGTFPNITHASAWPTS